MEGRKMEATEMTAEALASFFGADGPLAGAEPDFEAHVFDMSGAGKTEKAKAPEKAPGDEKEAKMETPVFEAHGVLPGSVEEAKMETKAYVLAYDLPSEYRSDYHKPATDTEAENHAQAKMAVKLIRATRIKATARLYACGLPASNSVIVVPTKKLEEAQKAIDEVKAMYAELSAKLKEMGFPALPEPLICLIPQVEVQVVSWASLAEREISRKLDNMIESMAKKMEEIGELEAKKAKSLKYKLRAQLRELADIEGMAKELGIDISGKAQLLSSMIKEAIEALEAIEEEE